MFIIVKFTFLMISVMQGFVRPGWLEELELPAELGLLDLGALG
jgi:hypothetical protein